MHKTDQGKLWIYEFTIFKHRLILLFLNTGNCIHCCAYMKMFLCVLNSAQRSTQAVRYLTDELEETQQILRETQERAGQTQRSFSKLVHQRHASDIIFKAGFYFSHGSIFWFGF